MVAGTRPLASLAQQLQIDPDGPAFIPYGRECAKIDSFAAGPGLLRIT